MVVDTVNGSVERTAFYDRDRALAWAAASPHRTMLNTPLRIRDYRP